MKQSKLEKYNYLFNGKYTPNEISAITNLGATNIRLYAKKKNLPFKRREDITIESETKKRAKKVFSKNNTILEVAQELNVNKVTAYQYACRYKLQYKGTRQKEKIKKVPSPNNTINKIVKELKIIKHGVYSYISKFSKKPKKNTFESILKDCKLFDGKHSLKEISNVTGIQVNTVRQFAFRHKKKYKECRKKYGI